MIVTCFYNKIGKTSVILVSIGVLLSIIFYKHIIGEVSLKRRNAKKTGFKEHEKDKEKVCFCVSKIITLTKFLKFHRQNFRTKVKYC